MGILVFRVIAESIGHQDCHCIHRSVSDIVFAFRLQMQFSHATFSSGRVFLWKMPNGHRKPYRVANDTPPSPAHSSGSEMARTEKVRCLSLDLRLNPRISEETENAPTHHLQGWCVQHWRDGARVLKMQRTCAALSYNAILPERLRTAETARCVANHLAWRCVRLKK